MKDVVSKVKGMSHVATAADVTAGTIAFYFGDFAPVVEDAVVQVKTAAGALKAWDGAFTVSGGTVTVDNTGVTDWAATDIVSVLAF